MRFDERFPNVKNFEDAFPGLYRGRFERPCRVCGAKTRWMDQDLDAALCGEECFAATIRVIATTSGDAGLLTLLQVDDAKEVGTERPYPLDTRPLKT
jgi:hypothetical protein